MHKNNSQKMVRKNKKQRRTVGRLRNNPNSLNRERIVSPVPDRTVVKLRQTLAPENLFAALTLTGGTAYYMNSIFEAKSGTSYLAPYLGGYALLYRKYRVIHSSVCFTFASREATKQTCFSVSPASGSAVASNATEFSELTSLPFAKSINLGPVSSGNNVGKIKISMKPEKLIGTHYNQQDEYAAAPGANPATLLYWQVSGFCADTFTASTGGVQVTAQIVQTIEYYEPDRDNTVSYKKYTDDLSGIDKAIDELTIQRSKLVRRVSM